MSIISWNLQFKVDLEDMQLKMFASYLNFLPYFKCEVPKAQFGHTEASICTTHLGFAPPFIKDEDLLEKPITILPNAS